MAKALKTKHVSKKNKSAWRKHTDVKDIEQFLEDQRQIERIGNFSEKKDDELFIVDTKTCPKLLLSAKERRKCNAKKPPKNLGSLVNTSAVPLPIAKRNIVKQKKNGRNILEEVINPSSQKHIQANKDRNAYHQRLEKKISKVRKRFFDEDIWNAKESYDLKEFHNQEWVSKNLALHHLKNTGRILAKAPKTLKKKTTALKPIEKPDPGTSYNPTLKDHQNLIQKVIAKEIEIIKEEDHLKRVTTNLFSKVTEEERDRQKMEELEAKAEQDDSDAQEQESDNKIYSSINPPVEIKKKGNKARRKQKLQKEIQNNLKKKNLERKKVTDIIDLKRINKEVMSEESRLKGMQNKKKLMIKKKEFGAKRLSRLNFKEPDLQFNNAEDIAGNLRNVISENSLLVDRFKVFQKRNILPVSVDVGVRKRRKIKRFVRSSHKE